LFSAWHAFDARHAFPAHSPAPFPAYHFWQQISHLAHRAL